MEKQKDKKLKARIHISIDADKKSDWLKMSFDKQSTLSNLIINSVDEKLLNIDRKEIMDFIEKQGNIFAKIENKINQIAKIVNTEKDISNSLLDRYVAKLTELNRLKIEQNDIFRKIYRMLAK